MGRASGIAGVLAGRRATWVVLAFWLVAAAIAGPLAGKLTGAEKNTAQS
jgi:RND superfamily putative drug exporter